MWRSELPGLRELEIWTRADKMGVSRLLALREIEVDVLKENSCSPENSNSWRFLEDGDRPEPYL